MFKTRTLRTITTWLILTGICHAQPESLDGNTVYWKLDITNIYQSNVKGGLSTHRRRGRFSGSYVFQVLADSESSLGIEGGDFYMAAEGSWSDGIDEPSVGSFFGVNGDAAGNRSVDISELWYEQSLQNNTFRIRLGKIDLTGGYKDLDNVILFDTTDYANCECTQFLNNALINNPTIPFPDKGLGIAVMYNHHDWGYLEAAVADAQADVRETGFETAFDGKDYFFYIFETGIRSQLLSPNGRLPGTYRAGLWYDPRPKANTDYAAAGKSYRDDVGVYVSFDQLLAKENADPEDTQGLGVFLRYGYAPGKTNDLTNFWSIGFQYLGLLQGRDADVLGLGFGQGFFSDKACSTYTEDYESVLELYYNARINPRLNISPSVQYIAQPAGTAGVTDAIVLGVRVQASFD